MGRIREKERKTTDHKDVGIISCHPLFNRYWATKVPLNRVRTEPLVEDQRGIQADKGQVDLVIFLI